MTPEEMGTLLLRQAQQLDDLEHAVTDLEATQTAEALLPAEVEDLAGPAFACASLPEFVETVIAPLYARHGTSNGGWCPHWWQHEEARVRLHAVWRAWEALRLDPSTGIARWLRDVADPQLDRLRDPDHGPFTACADRHLPPPNLPLTPAPDGFWDGTHQSPGATAPAPG